VWTPLYRHEFPAWIRQPVWLCVAAALICGVVGCVSTTPAVNGVMHAVQIPAGQRDMVWERSVDTLNRYHFMVARESKLEGVIQTEYRAGSNLLEPWNPDSLGFENRLESTLQSIRRRVFVTMQSSQPGLVTVSVRVDKEIEDLPGLAANYEGGATFPDSRPLARDLNQVVGQSGPSRWIYLGRDPVLEASLLNEIIRR
jgi:hypothetical protein